jgi:hypothetical protein
VHNFLFTVPLLLSCRNQNFNLCTCFSKILISACRVLFWRTERLSDFSSYFAGLRVGGNRASHCALREVSISCGLNTRKTAELPCCIMELYHNFVTCGDVFIDCSRQQQKIGEISGSRGLLHNSVVVQRKIVAVVAFTLNCIMCRLHEEK